MPSPELVQIIPAVSIQYLENKINGSNLTTLYIIIYIDKIYVGIVTRHFSQIRYRVMVLD